MYFAIRNKTTKEYIGGTDYRHTPPRQIMASEDTPPKLFSECELKLQLARRKINLKRYEVVAVKVIEKN